MKAQKKSVIIDYYSIEDTESSGKGLIEWIQSFGDDPKAVLEMDYPNNLVKVKTLEGISYDLTFEDMIIRGVNNEYYPCKKEIFEKVYNKLEDKSLLKK